MVRTLPEGLPNSILGLRKIPWEAQTHQYSYWRNPHGQRGAGHTNPQALELDTTKATACINGHMIEFSY